MMATAPVSRVSSPWPDLRRSSRGSRVGHLVLANPYRHPTVVAKMATTLDHMTGGRFILGLGAGWHIPETEAYGIDLPPIGERLASLRSAIEVIRALFEPAAAGWPASDESVEPGPRRRDRRCAAVPPAPRAKRPAAPPGSGTSNPGLVCRASAVGIRIVRRACRWLEFFGRRRPRIVHAQARRTDAVRR